MPSISAVYFFITIYYSFSNNQSKLQRATMKISGISHTFINLTDTPKEKIFIQNPYDSNLPLNLVDPPEPYKKQIISIIKNCKNLDHSEDKFIQTANSLVDLLRQSDSTSTADNANSVKYVILDYFDTIAEDILKALIKQNYLPFIFVKSKLYSDYDGAAIYINVAA